MQTMSDKLVKGRKTKDGYLVVTAQLHQLAGNDRPHFSVTAELWDSEGWYRNGQNGRLRACGQLVDEVSATFPELRPVLDVHLANDDGEPMHAEANGWYFYSDAYQSTLESAAHALHIEPCEFPEGMNREEFHAFVESLRPRWKAQAEAALDIIRTLSD
jgi:hypothetical protein